MKKITKDNLDEFINYYHGFHDSYITNINYDVKNQEIELFVDVFWSGVPTLREDNMYESNKIKMRMIFHEIQQCNNKEIFSWDYIHEVFIKYIKIDNKEYICFASDDEEPFVYIVCDNIEYEELGGII